MLEINEPRTLAEVTDAFERYEAALTGNDVEVLDELFWNTAQVVRYGATENLYGIEEIRAFRTARSPKGLDRKLRNTVITTFGTDFATACTEFIRPLSSQIGRQTQSWARFPEGWKIVAAHVSWMNE